MFDLTDEHEENMRREWYASIGEYVLLFSNLEFELFGWIDSLSDSRALKNFARGLQFSRRFQLLVDLIEECQVPLELKMQWKREWSLVEPLLTTRNLICHNSPIDNFALSLTKEGKVTLDSSVVEVHMLKKPVGEPGSGLTLGNLKEQTYALRQLLIRLDRLNDEKAMRCS